MIEVRSFDGAVALDPVQQIQQALGTGVTSGCAPSLPSGTSPITIDVASGTAYVANSEVTFGGGSITLPDGDPQHPRKDVVYVDDMGALQSIQGTPRAPTDGTPAPGTDREVYQPEPPDLSSLSSLADAAVVAEVWVPANASGTGEMTETGVTYVRDRRLRPWAAHVLTSSDTGSGSGLDADTVDGEDASAFADATHASTHHDGGADELDAADLAGGAGTAAQVLTTDGAAAAWAAVPTHASRHSDGGADELDVADLAGGLGSAAQVPQTDGAAVTWATLPHGDLASIGAADHHARYTDEEAQDAVGQTATDGLAYDDANNETGLDVVASGSVSLSAGGSATVDTGVSASTTATFSIYLGPTDGSQDADVAAEIRNDSGTGTYVIEIEETDTSAGPTVEFDAVRLR
jgi:hypothetical protein